MEKRKQPQRIVVDSTLCLVKYYPNYRRTLLWYQDPVLCKQVDNTEEVYDLDRLKRMYGYLSKQGECYYIKVTETGRSHLVGDISLWDGKIALVICREYQNRHIGRRAIAAMVQRAREIGLDKIEAEIYSFNAQSRACFRAAGFTQVGEELFEIRL